MIHFSLSKLQPPFRGGRDGNLGEARNFLDDAEVAGTLSAAKRSASFSLVGGILDTGFPGVGPRAAQT